MSLKPYLTSVRQTINSLHQIRIVRKSGRLTIADLHVPKTTGTLFILGSGPSINDITEEKFQHIRENTSIGFNFWAVHPFVPNIYALQAIPDTIMDQMLADIILQRRDAYNSVKFVIRGSRFNKGTYFSSSIYQSTQDIGEHYYSAELYFSSKIPMNTHRICDLLRITRVWGPRNQRSFSPKIGASITYLILFASQLGFRDIVLCGIDMNDSGHFYDTFDPTGYPYPIPKPLKMGTHPHRTMPGVTVLERIVDLQRYLQKLGVNVWISSENSQLAHFIPLYPWK